MLEALDSVRPYMESHGGDVELLGIEDGVARMRLVGHCKSCPASEATLELAIKKALEETAPDLEGLEVEGVSRPAFELPVVQSNGAPPKDWTDLDGAPPPPGLTAPMTVGGAEVLVANVGGTLLAYRNACGWCRTRLDTAAMTPGGLLTCPSCDAALRAAPRRALARRRRAPDRAGAAAAQGRPRPAGGRVMDPALVAGLRRFVRDPPAARRSSDGAHCELCPLSLADDHKHLLDLDERRILCVCPTCWSIRSGEARYRPTGSRTLWLEPFELSDELWAAFQVPIGLAFFMRSTSTGAIVGLYPSPAGATECELDLEAWDRLVAANPVLDDLDPDAEALVVNRLADPHIHVIAPLDDCYRLVGIVKATWEGISGGSAMEAAVARYFDDLRATALVR